MKVHHIVETLDVVPGGGMSTVVRELTAAQRRAGLSAVAHSVGGTRVGAAAGLPADHSLVGDAHRSPPRQAAQHHTLGDQTFFHSHGLWSAATVYGARASRTHRGSHHVVSPHGMLAPSALEHHRFRKRVAWQLGQARVLRAASAIHATSASEVDDIRRVELSVPVALIPHGVSIPPDLPPAGPEANGRTLLYLGRVHPIKGVDRLIHAWRHVQDAFQDWNLKIAGPFQRRYGRALRHLCNDLGVERVSLTGPADEEAKHRLFGEASLFVLPSHYESFGMTVAEALSFGVPVLVSRGAPWEGLEDRGCGWLVDSDVDGLVAGLTEALSHDPHELRRRGQRGRQWMSEDYSWDRVAALTIEMYAWVAGMADQPDWVHL